MNTCNVTFLEGEVALYIKNILEFEEDSLGRSVTALSIGSKRMHFPEFNKLHLDMHPNIIDA